MFDLLTDLQKLRPLISRQDKWKFVFLLGLMLIAALLEAIGIAAVPAFVTLIMKPSALAENQWVGKWFAGMPDEITLKILAWASVVLLLFVVLKNLFLTFVYYIQSRIVAVQRVKLADRMFRVYQSAPYEWHLQRSSSDFLRSIQNDTAQTLNGFIVPFLNLLMSIIMSAIIITILLVSTSGITLLALLVSAIGFLIVVRVFRKKLREVGRVNWAEAKAQAKAIQQGFGSLVDTRIIGCEEYLSKVHKDSLKRIAKAVLRKQVIQKATPYAMETFAILGLLIILYLLVVRADSLASVLPVIALLGVVMVRFKQIANQIAASINQMNVARAFIPRIVKDLHELEAIELQRCAKILGKSLISSFERLSLDNIAYTYPNTEQPAVQDISLELMRGESIAFVGATGCGKSTLVNLILGLLEPQQGEIQVNDFNIQSDANGWRKQLGYIPQSVYLIDDTISANVAFGCPEEEIDQDRLQKALDSACLKDFIESLPKGLETIVGEGGVRLSGGQRQRLGIARALYPNPEVLVMDEATSSLDNKTEELVMQAIQNLKKDRTLIMIAHRLSTVEDCDRLYLLQEGNIANVGTYHELIRTSSLFRELTASNDTKSSESVISNL